MCEAKQHMMIWEAGWQLAPFWFECVSVFVFLFVFVFVYVFWFVFLLVFVFMFAFVFVFVLVFVLWEGELSCEKHDYIWWCGQTISNLHFTICICMYIYVYQNLHYYYYYYLRETNWFSEISLNRNLHWLQTSWPCWADAGFQSQNWYFPPLQIAFPIFFRLSSQYFSDCLPNIFQIAFPIFLRLSSQYFWPRVCPPN